MITLWCHSHINAILLKKDKKIEILKIDFLFELTFVFPHLPKTILNMSDKTV